PDVWKIEGLESREDCEKVVAAARRGSRKKVGCIVLGRGEDDAKVRQWLATAATVPGFIGFAGGRTSFWQPLVALRDNKIVRSQAVSDIAGRYREFVKIFEGTARMSAREGADACRNRNRSRRRGRPRGAGFAPSTGWTRRSRFRRPRFSLRRRLPRLCHPLSEGRRCRRRGARRGRLRQRRRCVGLRQQGFGQPGGADPR